MNLDNAVSIATPLIAGFEGFSSKAYYDVNGYAIGYGNHYYSNGTSVQQGDTISKADATALLQVTVRDYATQIQPYIKVDISDSQFASLISLAYNCGVGAVQKSKVLQLINAGVPADQIEAQYKATCITAAGKYNEDLVARRAKEALAWAVTFVQQNKTWIIIVIGAVAASLVFYYTYRIEKA